jgi:hypothetical protein
MRGCVIVGEASLVKLLVRYNGIGKELTHDEKEILLFALYNESKSNGGLARQAEVECCKRFGKEGKED